MGRTSGYRLYSTEIQIAQNGYDSVVIHLYHADDRRSFSYKVTVYINGTKTPRGSIWSPGKIGPYDDLVNCATAAIKKAYQILELPWKS